MGGIHGLEHAALALFPLFALCDRFDAAGISIPRHPQVRGPAIFLYDAHPGGIGISRAIFPRLEELVALAGEIARECECADGCPSCIHSPRCGAGNHPLDKRAVIRVVDLALARAPLPELAPRASSSSSSSSCPGTTTSEEPAMDAAPRVAPLIFDVETQRSASEVGGWGNLHLMRLALAVVFDAAHRRVRDLHRGACRRAGRAPLRRARGGRLQRAPLRLRRAARLQPPLVRGAADLRPARGRAPEARLPPLARPPGDPDARAAARRGDGLQSLVWWKEGRIAEIEEYCKKDVELVRDLLEFAAREKHVIFQRKDGERVRLPVDWDERADPGAGHRAA